MLLRMPPGVQVAVLELGMSTPGELRRLAEIAAPDMGVLLNIGRAHLENFGSLDRIALAKAETGLVGLGIFLWLLASIFRVGYRTYRGARTPLFRALGLGLAVGVIALAAHSIGTNSFIIVRIMEPFWLFTGIVVRSLEIEAEEEEQAALALPSPTTSPAS